MQCWPKVPNYHGERSNQQAIPTLMYNGIVLILTLFLVNVNLKKNKTKCCNYHNNVQQKKLQVPQAIDSSHYPHEIDGSQYS